jgi:hypothetical protein
MVKTAAEHSLKRDQTKLKAKRSPRITSGKETWDLTGLGW